MNLFKKILSISVSHPHEKVYTDQENKQESPFIGLWSKVRSVLEENIQLFQSIYGPQFPIQFVQIRSHFCDIIEKQKWHTINPEDPGPRDHMKAMGFVRNILDTDYSK